MPGAAHVTGTEEFDKLISAGKPVLVDFYADWCGPCRMAEPIINKLADEFAGRASVVKMDVDDPANQEVVRDRHQIMSIPTVILYADGKEAGRNVGFLGEDGYRSMIEDGLKGK